MVWAKNGTPVTLGSAGDDIDINDLTAYKFNTFLLHTLRTGTGTGHNKRYLTTFDNNTATDYAWRRSISSGGEALVAGQASIDFDDGNEDESEVFSVIYGCNIDGEEKLFISNRIMAFVVGATDTMQRGEMVAKVDVTTNTGQYTDIDINNDLAGSYEVGSNLSVLGTD